MSGTEQELVADAIASNWVAPLGPHVDAFEQEICAYVGVGSGAATSSGTAALHLAMILLGVGRDDRVLCPTLTFSATVNPVVYQGAQPVFIDAEPGSWNVDPELVADELEACAARSRLPKAVIAVDLYGQTADYDSLTAVCNRYGVPLVSDAAEALGATYKGRKAGSFGRMAVLSFNGNKIITTSSGGMLLSDDPKLIEQARFLATQARDSAPFYQHSEIGYNYRMSNILAAIGRGQLQVLEQRIEAKRRNFAHYREGLADLPGLQLMPEAPWGRCTRWLTCLTIDSEAFGATPEDLRQALEEANIEARPVWKPMHLQPVFKDCRGCGGKVAEQLFRDGLCLPSGTALTTLDRERVMAIIRSCQR
jgi:pyridoxal phosphate-dependent aminotransferase EpsN